MFRLLEQPADPKPSKRELLRKQLFNLTEGTFEKHKAKGISGFKGVHLDKKNPLQRWRARGLDGKKSLGRFASKESAARARDHHVLSKKATAKKQANNNIINIAADLNFHPRNYLTPEGELLPLSEVVGLSEES